MPLTGEYEPSPSEWVRNQVETYERTGGKEANTLLDRGLPIIILTTRGNKTGKIRKFALMRVEHDGEYTLVASMGGAPKNPVWYYNLKADPDALVLQDGPEPFDSDSSRGHRRRVRDVVGTGGCGLSRLRRLPDEDRSDHSGIRSPSVATERRGRGRDVRAARYSSVSSNGMGFENRKPCP